MNPVPPAMTDTECDAAKNAVLSAVRETPLGRALLGALKRAGTNIVFTDQMPSVSENTRVYGLYMSAHNTVFMNAAAPLSAQLHFFAHESRHALQMQADAKIESRNSETSIHLLSPLTQLYLMRLRELDADAFAVHFLSQHDRLTGSSHSQTMRDVDVMRQQGMEYDRHKMYDAYAAAPDAKTGLRAAVNAFLADTPLVKAYNEFAVHAWQHTILPPIVAHADKPRSTYARAFAHAARHEAQADQPETLFEKRAAAYSKILNRSGMPDYLSGMNPAEFRRMVCETDRKTDPWKTTGRALGSAMLDFNAAIVHYSHMKPAANNNTPAAVRLRRKGNQP